LSAATTVVQMYESVQLTLWTKKKLDVFGFNSKWSKVILEIVEMILICLKSIIITTECVWFVGE
jgi:hypothetical protein